MARKDFMKYLINFWNSIAYWAIALFLFGFLRFYGIFSQELIRVHSGYDSLIKPSQVLPIFMIAGILIGVMFAFIEMLFDRYSSKRVSLGLFIVVKTLVHFAIIVGVSNFIMALAAYIYGFELDIQIGWWRTNKVFWVLTLYITLASLVLSFINIAHEKFGKGVFLKMLLGRYKEPKEEKRIFMFLDLKSSTTIAEALGHFKYSQLIQDCFYDINDVVVKYDAEIYQYVGDEVVLSWPYANGLANKNCVDLFFEFQNLLIAKKDYYREKYGVIPEFKAGLHGGKLMVAEVGVVKKELAFHGDVINTSARIQSECNVHNVAILISEKLKNDLNLDGGYKVIALGSVLLKGKLKEVDIYTLLKA